MTIKCQKKMSVADRAFARYREGRKPEDLAEVFDCCAPRLILVAMHFVHDRAAAEDLLQTTFVEAIEWVERFEGGEILTWLLMILSRRAKNEIRRRARHRAEPLEDSMDPSKTPELLAADREVFEKLADAIEALENPYREVLSLRFVHDLSPTEIARSLGRPIGTVHAQLHRGGGRLRRALPKDLWTVLVFVLVPERGLAAVRNSVLAAAGGAPMVAGGLMAKNGLLCLTAFMAIVMIAVWWSQSSASTLESHASIRARQENVALQANVTELLRDEHRSAVTESSRRLRFVPRCRVITEATIEGIWEQHGVRGELRAGNRILARTSRPFSGVDFGIDVGASTLIFALSGYKLLTIEVPEGNQDVELGLVVCDPDATVTIRFGGLPRVAQEWIGWNVTSLGSHGQLQEACGGRLKSPDSKTDISIAYPSAIPLLLKIWSAVDGDRSAVASGLAIRPRVITLDTGESRTIDLKLSKVIEGQLVGLPEQARSGQVISFQAQEQLPFALPSHDHGGHQAKQSKQMSATYGGLVRTNQDGRFHFLGVDSSSLYSLRLQSSDDYGGFFLVDVDGQPLAAKRLRALRVSPKDPVIGFAFRTSSGSVLGRRCVNWGSPPYAPGNALDRVPLISERYLRQGGEIHAYLKGVGHFSIPVAELELVDGLYSLRVPQDRGRLIVNLPDAGEDLPISRAVPDGGQLYDGIFAEIDGTTAVFEGLAPGDYWVYFGTVRRPAELVRVRSRATAVIEVDRLEHIEWQGKFADWNRDITGPKPTGVRLRHADPQSFTKVEADGTFRFKLLGEPIEVAGLEVWHKDYAAPVSVEMHRFVRAAHKIEALLPSKLKPIRIAMEPRFEGRGWIRRELRDSELNFRIGRALCEGIRFSGEHTLWTERSKVMLAVGEAKGSDRILRGWLRLRAGSRQRVDPGGRFIKLRIKKPRQGVNVFVSLKGPTWWSCGSVNFGTRALPNKLVDMWIPDGTTALELSDGRSFPIDAVGDVLEI